MTIQDSQNAIRERFAWLMEFAFRIIKNVLLWEILYVELNICSKDDLKILFLI